MPCGELVGPGVVGPPLTFRLSACCVLRLQAQLALEHCKGRYRADDLRGANFDYMSEGDGKLDLVMAWLQNLGSALRGMRMSRRTVRVTMTPRHRVRYPPLPRLWNSREVLLGRCL